jgi:NNP family nitrate/nitrite transporter-like MFS transporter
MSSEDEDISGLRSDQPTATQLETSRQSSQEEQISAQRDEETPRKTSEPAALLSPRIVATRSVEDGSLMHLYESRLRRLRDYESKVYSRGSGRALNKERDRNNDAQDWQEAVAPLPGQHLSDFDQPIVEGAHSPRLYHGGGGGYFPSVINVEEQDGESLDDLTLSTGINSAVFSPPEFSESNFQNTATAEEEKEDLESGPSLQSSQREASANRTEYSTDSSSEKCTKNSTTRESSRRESTDLNEAYIYQAGADSKFETYSVLVDPEKEDRAVEIALYSAARPHMRGFHFAWISFFVAFFAWFSITPLLSEVAASLNLTRKEIWTSSTLAVAGSAVTRILIGPVNDIYGARWTMFGTLVFSAIPCAIAGVAIQNAASLYVIRLLIGVAGSAFVTCQFWTSSVFVSEVAGTANSLAAGWGNLGGGVAQVVMGSLLFPLFKVIYGGEGYGSATGGYVNDDTKDREYDRASDLAWRTILVFPALLCLYMAYVCIRYCDDCPKGNFRKRKLLGLMPIESAKDAIRRGASNYNTWLLFLQYGCCFGVEITMTNAAALYFQEEFGQNTETAAAIASIFGWMNLFARGIGGFASDMASATYGMRGRLWVQVVTLVAEGGLVCVFSTTHTLAAAIVVMALFSIFVQAAEGSTFAIVPYVDYAVTGSIAGVVGAGGNVGGVAFSLFFREFENRDAFLAMGCIVLVSSFITALLAIPGHRSLVKGEDAPEVAFRRDTHAEQLGNRPLVELHTHNGEGHKNRQTVLRAEAPTLVDAENMPNETEEPSTVSGRD